MILTTDSVGAAASSRSPTISDSLCPRRLMEERLPRSVQPFLSWLTAKPASWEAAPRVSPLDHVVRAFALTIGGTLLSLGAIAAGGLWPGLAVVGLVLTTSGLSRLQAVVLHHAAHGTVLASRPANRRLGRLISALLLIKRFDDYQREHMLHHSARKLLTDEDEFAQFMFGLMHLEPGLPLARLRRRVVTTLLSPSFHLRWLLLRAGSALTPRDPGHAALAAALWIPQAALAILTGQFGAWLVAWVVPVTVLYQWTTAGRVLCEHRFPDEVMIRARGKEFVCLATTGVFAGQAPTGTGPAFWIGWWSSMLTVHLLSRVLVLVGDAPCHDYHHRRPGSRGWAGYAHARQADADAGCPGYPLNYVDSWGLVGTIERNLATLAAARPSR
ncbi:MAG TPA: fatty acid desaturase [Arenibaculum sp.]|nr:fatty acid desaturase [Arenibaculum sp.]